MGVASKVSKLGCVWGIVFFCSETNTDMSFYLSWVKKCSNIDGQN